MVAVGFIGLGIMDHPMLNNLLKTGHTVIVYGRNPKKLDACAAQQGASFGMNENDGLQSTSVIALQQ